MSSSDLSTPEAVRPDRFADRPAFLLAGVRERHGFDDGWHGVAAQWRRFAALHVANAAGAARYGAMCGADPAGRWYEYLAGVEVSSFAGEDPSLGRMRVPAAHYAVFTHRGGPATLPAAWQRIIEHWLPASGYESAHTPDFELYAVDPLAGEGTIEIWIGIRPRA